MLGVLERNELLDEAERISARRDYRALATFLGALPEDALFGDPELPHLLALAWYQIDRCDLALEMLNGLAERFGSATNNRLYRRRLNLQATCLFNTGDLQNAEQLLLQVLAAASQADDQLFIASATSNLGVIADIRCEWTDAIAAYRRALAAFQRLGDQASIGACYHNLGMTFRQLGHLSESGASFDTALEYFRRLGSPEEIAGTESERALLFLLKDDVERAEKTVARSYTIMSRIGNERMMGEILRVWGIVHLKRQRTFQARTALEQALVLARSSGNSLLEAEVCEEMGQVETFENHDGPADAWRMRAREIYRSAGAITRAERV